MPSSSCTLSLRADTHLENGDFVDGRLDAVVRPGVANNDGRGAANEEQKADNGEEAADVDSATLRGRRRQQVPARMFLFSCGTNTLLSFEVHLPRKGLL